MDVLFIWIPKNAGTAINWVLRHKWGGCRYGRRRFGVPADEFKNEGIATFGHYSIPALIKSGIMSQEFLDKALTFAVVRNPFERVVSFAAHSLKRNRKRGNLISFWSALHSILDCLETGSPHRLGLYNSFRHSSFQPQSRWIDDESGQEVANVLLRHETLTTDWRRFCDDHQLPHHALPHIHRSEHPPAADVLAPHMIEVIADYYADDFERFGYEKKPGGAG